MMYVHPRSMLDSPGTLVIPCHLLGTKTIEVIEVNIRHMYKFNYIFNV